MKKNLKIIIPVAAGIFLILLLGSIYLIRKNAPNKEKMQLTKYFGIEKGAEQAKLITDDEITDAGCLYRDKKAYIAFDYVKNNLNSGFYWDDTENLLLYTTPTTELSVAPGSTDCMNGRSKEEKGYVMVISEGGQIFVAADYVKEYTALDYRIYENPNRVVITKDFNVDKDYVKTTEESAVRYKPDIKSKVLKNVKEKEELRLLTKEDKKTGFCRVMEKTGIIGYVKAGELDQAYQKKKTTQFKEETYTHILKDKKVSLLWHQVTNQTANRSLSELLSGTQGVNVVSPTWLKTSDNNGGVDASIASDDYVTKAHSAGVEVWGLCDDQSPDMKIGTVLGKTSTRLKLVNNLVAKAIQYNLDGLNIDFEYIKKESGEDFVQFLRELSIKCRSNSLVLSVDNYPMMDYNAYYNIKEQAKVVDYVITMAYDEYHKNSEEAGPVSSLSYVQDSIKKMIKDVPKEQSIIGLPFYSRHWQEKTKDGQVKLSVESCSMKYTKEIVEDSGTQPVWDDKTGQNYLEYNQKGVLHKMWIEDQTSLELKMKEWSSNGLAGCAFWKYGLEDKNVWSMIVKYTK